MAPNSTRTTARILGLTGPIACGKSTIGGILLRLGALERVDADQVVHRLMAAGTDVTRQIAQAFGTDVLQPDGSVDRAALGHKVFSDPGALRALESIVHPAVRQDIRQRIGELAGEEGVVVVDAVRLLQSELLELCDAVWVVRCRAEEQMRRLVDVRRMTPAEAEGRLAAQPSFEHPKVTMVIDNSGSFPELEKRVEEEWRLLLRAWKLPARQPGLITRSSDTGERNSAG